MKKILGGLLTGAVIVAALSGTAWAQTLILATDRVGTGFNAAGSGLAKIITEGSSLRVIVRPFGGPDAYLDPLESGEVQLAAISATSTHWAAAGKNPSGKVYKNLRILRSGAGGVRLTFAVARDSDIKSLADLRGHKVASNYGGHAVLKTSTTATLATAGLTWNDVQPVPVTGAVEGVRELGTGRVDASWAAFGMPIAREVNAKIGIRYLSFDNSAKTMGILKERLFPGSKLVMMKANPKMGVDQDSYFLSFDSYLVANKDLDDATVKTILEALWKETDQLVKIHRNLRGFTHNEAVTTVPMVPYHPAAVAFYKEKGVWSAAAEAANNKAMKQ
jgi:TRAP transporter TAXI family solute receptor